MILRISYGNGSRCGRNVDPHGLSVPEVNASFRTSPRMEFGRLPVGIYNLTPDNAAAAEHWLEVFEDGTGRYELHPLHPNESGVQANNIIELPDDRTVVAITETRMGRVVLFDMLTYTPGESPSGLNPADFDGPRNEREDFPDDWS